MEEPSRRLNTPRDLVRILVVDDIESNLTALDALLGDASTTVVRARSGAEALEALQNDSFSLVILDVQMPEMDGFDTAAAIRSNERSHRVPIIFVTAHGESPQKLARAYAVGASDFLTKPLNPDALAAKVATIRNLWRSANELKDEFLATLSHELRTPLHAILGWTAILKERGPVEPQFSRALEVIERNANAQARLIDDMLDTSRIVAGTLRVEMHPVQASKILEELVEGLRPEAVRKHLVLRLALDPATPTVSGDSERLRQVFSNLLSNAIKFTGEGGEVSVRMSVSRGHVVVSVTDTGIGITPEFLPHLFDRFRQAEGSRRRTYGGLGIGLSLARQFVRLHGGTLEASSAGAGKGATFVVRLPIPAVIRSHAKSDEVGPGDPGPSLRGVGVLIVDDHPDARELLQIVLEGAGADVRVVESAEAALAVLAAWRPTVIVSDIGMAGTDGCELMRRIRALAPRAGGDVPAIALTAFSTLDDVAEVRAAGFDAHLPKPVDQGRLLATIRSTVARAGLRRPAG